MSVALLDLPDHGGGGSSIETFTDEDIDREEIRCYFTY